jgi:hypothetical protein
MSQWGSSKCAVVAIKLLVLALTATAQEEIPNPNLQGATANRLPFHNPSSKQARQAKQSWAGRLGYGSLCV